MPLLDLKTNLKDLKFGRDERGGGNSGQPYVVSKIPATNEPLQTGFSGGVTGILAGVGAGAAIGAIGGSILGSTGTGAAIGAIAGLGIGLAGTSLTGNGLKIPTSGTGGPDYLLRGGTLLPNAIVDDETRLGKFFASTKGLLFITKQNLLSRISVRTQASPNLLNDGVYTPLSTLIQAAVLPFGGHVNKQGLNPFERVTYFDIIKNEIDINGVNTNRLYNLKTVKILRGEISFLNPNNISFLDTNLLSYSGGPDPDAPLGIGKTNIRYATDNINNPLKINNVENNTTLNYSQLDDESDFNENYRKSPNIISPIVRDFRTLLKNQTKSLSYETGKNFTIERRTSLGDPGNQFSKKTVDYVNGYSDNINQSYGAASPNSYDKINALPIYRSNVIKDPTKNNPNNYPDLINFRIGVIDNDINSDNSTNIDYIHFRAFLNQISDNYKANWSSTKYIGRGENFYTYDGFERRVSLSWTVAAQSKVELIPMYKKLNYLASLCAPDYSKGGYMRGNIVKLTIGSYFYEQPGIITGLSYEMNDENDTWEIGISNNNDNINDDSVRQLPHLIRVNNFEFIPIHEFVPRKQKLTFNETNTIKEYGPEGFIALKNENNTSAYTSTTSTPVNFSQQDIDLFNKFKDGLPLPTQPSNNIGNPSQDLNTPPSIDQIIVPPQNI